MPTPPGKKRVAFRGQYIFVTDDEYDSDDDSDDGATPRSPQPGPPRYNLNNILSRKFHRKFEFRQRLVNVLSY